MAGKTGSPLTYVPGQFQRRRSRARRSGPHPRFYHSPQRFGTIQLLVQCPDKCLHGPVNCKRVELIASVNP
ncbi:Uncharacterised protein [Escherichia coli]|uniref:Uncharacterized protein n=1 Tax=Escherichia coli TaxID=562 RepID=A0A376YPF2_ECOLX|nr:Uncharacterised protein [Escherichia coli]